MQIGEGTQRNAMQQNSTRGGDATQCNVIQCNVMQWDAMQCILTMRGDEKRWCNKGRQCNKARQWNEVRWRNKKRDRGSRCNGGRQWNKKRGGNTLGVCNCDVFLFFFVIKLLCMRKLLAFGEVSGKLVSIITYKVSVTKNGTCIQHIAIWWEFW